MFTSWFIPAHHTPSRESYLSILERAPNVFTMDKAREKSHAKCSGCICHALAPHGQQLIIWASCKHEEAEIKRFTVFDTSTKEWSSLPKSTGQTPEYFDCLQVVGNKLYAFAIGDSIYEQAQGPPVVHALDLQTHAWDKPKVTGVKPVPAMSIASAVWKDKVYLFGGYGRRPGKKNVPLRGERSQIEFKHSPLTQSQYSKKHHSEFYFNNQLVAYNSRAVKWEWPKCKGQVPAPGSGAGFAVSGDYMLNLDCKSSTVHMLHLPSHKWTSVAIEMPEKWRFSALTAAVEMNRVLVLGKTLPGSHLTAAQLAWENNSIEKTACQKLLDTKHLDERALGLVPDGERVYELLARYVHNFVHEICSEVTAEESASSSSSKASPPSLFEASLRAIVRNGVEFEEVAFALPPDLEKLIQVKLNVT